MKNLIAIAFLFFFSIVGYSQNLVPNSGFDVFTSCPSMSSQYELTPPWSRVDSTKGTPDYMHICSTSPNQGIPNNFYGYQVPVSDSGYYGLITYYQFSEVREYLTCNLLNEMVAGKRYHVGFYVSLCDTMKFATDQIGAHLSTSSLVGNGDTKPLNYIPQVHSPKGLPILDKDNWTLISDTIIANGGENHITIGNFFDDIGTLAMSVNLITTIRYGYYYLDEVFVLPLKLELIAADTICLGDSVFLHAINEEHVIWTDSLNQNVILSDSNFFAFSPSKTTTISLLGSEDTLYHKVVVQDLPEISLGSDTVLCNGDVIEISFANTEIEYHWQDGFIGPNYQISGGGIYILLAQSYNCTITDTLYVQNYQCETTVVMPNIFTPNNDGKNDYFEPVRIENLDLQEIIIFNQWGKVIFNRKDFTNTWDGKCNGLSCEEGVYFWKIIFLNHLGNVVTESGFVHLLR